MSGGAITLVLWLWGFLLSMAVRRTRGEHVTTTVLKGLSLSPLLSFGFLSASWFLALWLKRPDALLPLYGLLLTGLYGISRWLRTAEASRPVLPGAESRWVFLPLLLGAGLTALSLFLDRAHGRGGSDAMAIWNFAARFMFRSGVDYPSLLRAFDPSHHFDYPLFIPGAIAAQWHLTGWEDWAVVRWTHGAFLLPLAALTFEIMRGFMNARTAAAGSAAILLTPALLIWGQRQYADSHTSFAFLGAAGFLALLLHSSRAPVDRSMTAGLFLGALPWTKNEGIPLALLLLVVFMVLARRHGKTAGQRIPGRAIAIGAAFFVTALVLFKTAWPPANDLLSRGRSTLLTYLLSQERWITVLKSYGGEFAPCLALSRRRWGASLILLSLLFALFVVRRRWRQGPFQLMTLWVVLLSWGGWILVYVLTPQELEWHLTTSMNRLVLQIVPAHLLLLIAAQASPRASDHEVAQRRK